MTVTVDSEFPAYIAGFQRERDALVTALEEAIRWHWRVMQMYRRITREPGHIGPRSIRVFRQLMEEQVLLLSALLQIRRA